MFNEIKSLDTKVLKRLFTYAFKRYRIHFFIIIIGVFISSIVSVISSLFLKNLIDNYITPILESHTPNFAPLGKVLIGLSFVYLLGVCANYLYHQFTILLTQGILRDLRIDVFKTMERLPLRFFDTKSHGAIMSIYTNDMDTLMNLFDVSFPDFLNSTITIISVFTSMIILSVPLTLIIICMLWVMKKVVSGFIKKASTYFSKQQESLAKETGFIEEMIEGSKVIKVFTQEENVLKQFEKINDELFDASYNANKYSVIVFPTINNISNISYVITALVGSYLAIEYQLISIGTLVSFLALNRSFNIPIMNLSQQIHTIIGAVAGAKRVFELLDEQAESNDGKITLVNYDPKTQTETSQKTNYWAWKHPHQDDFSLVPLQGNVIFEDVCFSYNEGQPILKNINLTAQSGQKIAFVGATGAGKTTITNLLNRFYDIQSGTILYDGVNIQTIEKNSLRKSLGFILQDTHLFSGTIAENIKYGAPDATDEEMINAAKLANAHEFIMHLENDYNTVLTSDGSPLSQGQKQLLSIARAALANAPVLILDEATSSIDSLTEKIVQNSMDKLMANRTTFVIAHRLSTIQNADLIIVLDKGVIMERGTHEQLIEKKGIYYQLYTGAIEMD